MNADIQAIETTLLTGKGTQEALQALYRVRDRLPAPTLWEQFAEFPIGTQFQSEDSNKIHYVKASDTAVVRVDGGYASGPVIEYVDDLAKRFPFWSTRTDTFTVVL